MHISLSDVKKITNVNQYINEQYKLMISNLVRSWTNLKDNDRTTVKTYKLETCATLYMINSVSVSICTT